ncbi:uncharacterized protein [Pocillopora verrucosa]|uniref:uncharacterized protein n=1 Tax=Pocillopora verrucosa TaxID=203993 RepID=UPI003342D66E
MALCSYITLVGKVTPCGRSPDYPGQVECITLENCSKDVTGHLSTLGLSADEGSRTEMKLLLARAAICTRCDEFICGQVANEQTPVEGAGASIVSNPKEPRVMVQIPEQQTMVLDKGFCDHHFLQEISVL